MDYNKIGNLILSERKAKKLTQAQLAQKLFVSEKTISKWENGNGVPDAKSLVKLCEVFEITINELLNGERISAENYENTAENTLFELQKNKEEKDKMLLHAEIVLGCVSTILFLVIIYSSLYAINELKLLVLPIIMIVVATLCLFVSLWLCLSIEQKAGYYLCEKCNHKYIPKYKQVLFAPHINRTRHMKCPNCKQKSWHKKVLK